MQILKETGTYLTKKAESNRNYALACFILASMSLIIPPLFWISLPLVLIGGFFFKRFLDYGRGSTAEKRVIEQLSTLSNDYFLINDLELAELWGNIDHIVLGPNGIFVVETKDYGGDIFCKGDEWSRRYKGGLKLSSRGRTYWKPERKYQLSSPSKQVKRSAILVKKHINVSEVSRPSMNLWVEGIVVFTNPNVKLHIEKPSVEVLLVEEIVNFIKNKKSRKNLSSHELKMIGNALLKEQN